MNELYDLMRLAAERGQVLYNIMCRRAGWGISWYVGDGHDSDQGDAWKSDIKTYRYYKTLEDAVQAETERISKLPVIPVLSVVK